MSIIYRIEIDGVMLYEECKTLDEAKRIAKIYFKKDHSRKEARFYKYGAIEMGLYMKNKFYDDGEANNG